MWKGYCAKHDIVKEKAKTPTHRLETNVHVQLYASGERGIASSRRHKEQKNFKLHKFGLSNYGASQVNVIAHASPPGRHRRQASGQMARLGACNVKDLVEWILLFFSWIPGGIGEEIRPIVHG